MINWQEVAKTTIEQVSRDVPDDADLAFRKKALRAARPWEFAATSWGRKVWAKHARKYLEKHGLPPLHKVSDDAPLLSPLDKQREKALRLSGQS